MAENGNGNGNGNGKKSSQSAPSVISLIVTVFGAVLSTGVIYTLSEQRSDHDSLVELRATSQLRIESLERQLVSLAEQCREAERRAATLEQTAKSLAVEFAKVENKANQYFEIDSRNILARVIALERDTGRPGDP